jgi:predicted AlkP superfamily phosphohydrolase/phosphomutase
MGGEVSEKDVDAVIDIVTKAVTRLQGEATR